MSETERAGDPERAAWKTQALAKIQRARQLEAVRQIQSGELRVPIVCSHCQSESVTEEKTNRVAPASRYIRCITCSRTTLLDLAHRQRQQRIKAIVSDGVDIDVRKIARTAHTTTQ